MGCGFCESALSNTAGHLLADWVVKPIGHQLDYIRRFHKNVEKLKKEKEALATARDRLQHDVEEARLGQLQTIEGDVQKLQLGVENILRDVEGLETEIGENKRCFIWCPNWCWRYRLSKKARKKRLAISELLHKTAYFCQLGRVGYHSATTTVSTVEFLSSKDFVVSKASKTASKQLIEALQDDNVNMIGLWGMGGVGKTTLVREVGNQAKELHLFDKVVIATVSREPNFETIQDEIAKDLDHFSMTDEPGSRRSTLDLWLRLQEEKRILIILDDVWAEVNLKEKIGIPLGEDHKGSCKVILTTRRGHVCRSMKCQREVQLGCLENGEAWELFEMKTGLDHNSDVVIREVATQVIKKCDGLPIAIVTLGSALKGKNLHQWEAACRRLKTRRLFDIEDVKEENAYLCLELSFDYVKDRATKICFLLCSLFPEDYVIDVEDLVRYSWGLELYKGLASSVEEVRGEVLAAIDILKDSCLLLDCGKIQYCSVHGTTGCGKMHVKMHDMVRDVALWIASGQRENLSFVMKSGVDKMLPNDASFEPCTAISINTSMIAEVPEKLACPNLEILLLGVGEGVGMSVSSDFLEEMKALKVCHVHDGFFFPRTFWFQSNLRTLCLTGSTDLGDISSIGKLKELQILSFKRSNITELPSEIGGLRNLKLLDLSNCDSLERIPPNLLRSLSQLEELYISFWNRIEWAVATTSEEETNASLLELDSLLNLAALCLKVLPKYIPQGFMFPKLKRYDLVTYNIETYFSTGVGVSRSLTIEASALEACKRLLGNVESLNLTGLAGYNNLVPCLELEQGTSTKLTCLILKSCKDVKYLLDATMHGSSTTTFSNLIQLELKDMLGFVELCNGDQPQGFLKDLKKLLISDCNNMISAVPVLQNLEEVHVKNCEKMPVLFQIDRCIHTEEEPKLLQSLKQLYIDNCNQLTHLFPTSVAKSLGSLRQLESLKIHKCLGLTEIIQETKVPKMNLQSLREVYISKCNNLTSLSSLSHGRVLENLTKLVIRNCSQLEYTFPVSMAKGLPQLKEVCLENLTSYKGSRDGNDTVLTLPSLEVLKVENCPLLTPFTISEKIQGPIQAVNFNNLTELKVHNCKSLGYIFSPMIAQSLPKLNSLGIFGCEQLERIIGKGDTTSSQTGHLLQPNLCFPSLTNIWIGGCENLKSILPVSVAHLLPKLRYLFVQGASKLEQVFEEDGGGERVGATANNDVERVIHLPELEIIRLRHLPGLVSFGPVGYRFEFSSLSELEVTNCPKVTPRFWVDSKQSWHAKTYQAPIQAVSFASLTKLRISDCKSLAYIFSPTIACSLPKLSSLEIYGCEQLEQIIGKEGETTSSFQPDSCFLSLTGIWIMGCENLKSILPVSVGHRLPKLRYLFVHGALKLEQVFEGGEDDIHIGANVSNGVEKVIRLLQLEEIRLRELPSLVSFGPQGYHFEFPSLCRFDVRDCPKVSTSFWVDSKQCGHAKTEHQGEGEGEGGRSIGGDVEWQRQQRR